MDRMYRHRQLIIIFVIIVIIVIIITTPLHHHHHHCIIIIIIIMSPKKAFQKSACLTVHFDRFSNKELKIHAKTCIFSIF